MVRIPYIKIPSVRVGSIVPTSNIGTGGATPAPPTPITYLTQWKIVGNSEVHGNEIWSCGEYSAVDGKYHILVQPLGGSVADIALDEPLRMVNNVADTIQFPSETEGKALVTRNLSKDDLGDLDYVQVATNTTDVKRYRTSIEDMKYATVNILTAIYNKSQSTYACIEGINTTNQYIFIYDVNYNQAEDTTAFVNHVRGSEILYELDTPTTELVDAPQIEEADSYTCEISQGGKAVEWSSFETDSE